MRTRNIRRLFPAFSRVWIASMYIPRLSMKQKSPLARNGDGSLMGCRQELGQLCPFLLPLLSVGISALGQGITFSFFLRKLDAWAIIPFATSGIETKAVLGQFAVTPKVVDAIVICFSHKVVFAYFYENGRLRWFEPSYFAFILSLKVSYTHLSSSILPRSRLA